MKLIYVEEHAVDQATVQAALPTMEREAPYMRSQSSGDTASQPGYGQRPVTLDMKAAVRLGEDLGAGRLRNMDKHGIDLQIVSYTSPAQLAHGRFKIMF